MPANMNPDGSITANAAMNAANAAALYNPVAGFVVFFDWVTGLQAKHDQVCLIFQLLDGTAPMTKVRDAPAKETEWDSTATMQSGDAVQQPPKQKRCALAFKKPFTKVHLPDCCELLDLSKLII